MSTPPSTFPGGVDSNISASDAASALTSRRTNDADVMSCMASPDFMNDDFPVNGDFFLLGEEGNGDEIIDFGEIESLMQREPSTASSHAWSPGQVPRVLTPQSANLHSSPFYRRLNRNPPSPSDKPIFISSCPHSPAATMAISAGRVAQQPSILVSRPSPSESSSLSSIPGRPEEGSDSTSSSSTTAMDRMAACLSAFISNTQGLFTDSALQWRNTHEKLDTLEQTVLTLTNQVDKVVTGQRQHTHQMTSDPPATPVKTTRKGTDRAKQKGVYPDDINASSAMALLFKYGIDTLRGMYAVRPHPTEPDILVISTQMLNYIWKHQTGLGQKWKETLPACLKKIRAEVMPVFDEAIHSLFPVGSYSSRSDRGLSLWTIPARRFARLCRSVAQTGFAVAEHSDYRLSVPWSAGKVLLPDDIQTLVQTAIAEMGPRQSDMGASGSTVVADNTPTGPCTIPWPLHHAFPKECLSIEINRLILHIHYKERNGIWKVRHSTKKLPLCDKVLGSLADPQLISDLVENRPVHVGCFFIPIGCSTICPTALDDPEYSAQTQDVLAPRMQQMFEPCNRFQATAEEDVSTVEMQVTENGVKTVARRCGKSKRTENETVGSKVSRAKRRRRTKTTGTNSDAAQVN